MLPLPTTFPLDQLHHVKAIAGFSRLRQHQPRISILNVVGREACKLGLGMGESRCRSRWCSTGAWSGSRSPSVSSPISQSQNGPLPSNDLAGSEHISVRC